MAKAYIKLKEILYGQFEELAINTAKFATKTEFSDPSRNEVYDVAILGGNNHFNVRLEPRRVVKYSMRARDWPNLGFRISCHR